MQEEVAHEQYSAEEVAAFFVSSYFEELVKGQRNTNWYSDTAKTEVQNVAEGTTEYGQGGDHLGTVQQHFTDATTDITAITVEDASESLETVLVHCEGTAATATAKTTFVQQVTLFLKEGSYYIVKELFKIRQVESLIEEAQEEQVQAAAAEPQNTQEVTEVADTKQHKQEEVVEETSVAPPAETQKPTKRSKPVTPTPEPTTTPAAATAATTTTTASNSSKPKTTYLDHLKSNPTVPHPTAPKVITASTKAPEKEKEKEKERPNKEVVAPVEPQVRGHCFFKDIQSTTDAKAEMSKFLEKLGYGNKEIKSLRATVGNNGGCNVFVDLSVPNALEAFNEARDTYKWKCTPMTPQHRERPPKQQ